MEKETIAFQDLIGLENHCHGCGIGNPNGFYLKSYWDDNDAVATWKPLPHHTAGSLQFVNGGILASLIDCHSNNLAMASSYHREGRKIGSDPKIWCVTAQLKIEYIKPVPIDREINLRATLIKQEGRKTWIKCILSIDGKQCALGEVLLIELKKK